MIDVFYTIAYMFFLAVCVIHTKSRITNTKMWGLLNSENKTGLYRFLANGYYKMQMVIIRLWRPYFVHILGLNIAAIRTLRDYSKLTFAVQQFPVWL